MADQVAQYREKLLDSVVETDEALMERYLDGQELAPRRRSRRALKAAVTRGELFPVACGVATKNLGTTAMLDLLVEGVPSPAKKGAPIEIEGAGTAVVRLQDRRRPVRRPHQHLPRPPGRGRLRLDARQRAHARQGASRPAAHASGQGPRARGRVRRGRHRRGREAEGRDDRRPAARLRPEVELPSLDFPEPVMSFAITPKAKGDEEKVAHVAAAAERGGPDAAASAATRRPASSSSRG